MSLWLKQSTAIEIKVGPFVDNSDGYTAETGLTITQAEVLLAKNDGDWAQKNESTSLVHESNGWYRCLLDATDTNTLGALRLQIAESGALPVWTQFMVLPANVYDSLVSGSDVLDVSTTQFNGSAVTQSGGRPEVNATHLRGSDQSAIDLKDFADDGYDPSTNKVQGVVLTDTATTLTNAPSDSSGVTTLLSRLTSTRAGYLDNLSAGAVATAAKLLSYFQSALRKDVTVDSDIGGTYDDATDSLEAQRDNVGTNGAALALAKGSQVTGFNDLSAAQVNAEADTALADYDPPTRAELTTDTNSILSKLLKYVQLMLRKDAAIATDNATEVTAINADGGSGAGAFANTTDAQEAIRDNMGTPQTGDSFARLGAPAGASVSADIAAIEAQTDDIGAAGAGLTAVPWNPAWDAEVQSEVEDGLAAYDPPTKAELDSAVAPLATAANLSTVSTNVSTLLTRIPAALFAGITSLAEWLGLMAGKQTGNSTARTELRATGAGSGTYDETADSQEALRDRGDAAWATATGFSTLDAAGVRTAVGLASANLDTQLTAIDDYLDTEVAAIKAKTDNLPADPADASDIAASFATVNTKLDTIDDLLDTEVAALAAAVEALPTNSELATALAAADDAVLAAIAALNNLSAAQVNAEVVDALTVDAQAEPTAVPAHNASVASKVSYIFQRLVNKSTLNKDTGVATHYRQDSSTTVGTNTDSDDGTTFTKGKAS